MFVFLLWSLFLSIQMSILRISVALNWSQNTDLFLGCKEGPQGSLLTIGVPWVSSDSDQLWHHPPWLRVQCHKIASKSRTNPKPVLPTCCLHLLSWVPISGFSWFATVLEVRETIIYPYLKGCQSSGVEGHQSMTSPTTFQDLLHPDLWSFMEVSFCGHD